MMQDRPEQPPSKTQKKRAMHELQALGEALVDLNPERLGEIPMPEMLREAVLEAQTTHRREARRRQLQYIGRLMREVDADPIRAKLAQWQGQSAEATRVMHAIERWRMRLLDDDAALTEFARTYPVADLQALRGCIREARKEQVAIRAAHAQGRHGEAPAPRRFRELYQMIKPAIEQEGTDE